jgi:hypothetical protein
MLTATCSSTGVSPIVVLKCVSVVYSFGPLSLPIPILRSTPPLIVVGGGLLCNACPQGLLYAGA